MCIRDSSLPDTATEVIESFSNNEAALRMSANTVNAITERNEVPPKLAETKLLLATAALKLNLDDAKRLGWRADWADALQRLGRHEEAVETLTELATQNPKVADFQIQLARSLSKIGGDVANQNALTNWRRLVRQLKPKTENWFEAKLNVATLLLRTGEKNEALTMLEYIKAIPPGWSKSKWKPDFEQLMAKCQN